MRKMRTLLLSLPLFGYIINAHPVAEGSLKDGSHLLSKRAAANASDIVFGDANSTTGNGDNLLNFQISPPVLSPPDVKSDCVVTLAERAFAHSYYQPFVGSYKPPSCKFDRVLLNFTLHTFGTQYDRMGTLFLGDNEIFRLTTAEPGGNDIAYTHWKEVDEYLALFKEEQKVILDIPNIVDGTYTGILYVTLTATFYQAADNDKRAAADKILPISSGISGEGKASTFEVPRDAAKASYTFPSNINRAVVGIAATGQQREEFWYKNALTSDHKKPQFEPVTKPHSSFREIQLMIDGQLAGVSWPFPGIFTGGINPAFWRPMVGIDAFDLRQAQIDITPWLGVLCDGKQHTFEISIAGLEDDGKGDVSLGINKVEWFWVVSANIFLFSGSSGSDTTKWMSKPTISAPEPDMSVSSQFSSGALNWNVKVKRALSVTSTLISDPTKKITWSQTLNFDNKNTLNGPSGSVKQVTSGEDKSSPVGYINSYNYPHAATWGYTRSAKGLSIDGTFDQSQSISVMGPSLFPNGIQDSSFGGAKSKCPLPTDFKSWPKNMFDSPSLQPASFLNTHHTGKARYGEQEGEKGYEGITSDISQDFTFSGLCIPPDSDISEGPPTGQNLAQLESYDRHVKVVNEVVSIDDERLTIGGKKVAVPSVEGILQWRRPVTPSLGDSPNAGQPTQPTGPDAELQAILGIGDGELGPGYQTKPEDNVGSSNGTTEPGIQAKNTTSSTVPNSVVPVGTF